QRGSSVRRSIRQKRATLGKTPSRSGSGLTKRHRHGDAEAWSRSPDQRQLEFLSKSATPWTLMPSSRHASWASSQIVDFQVDSLRDKAPRFRRLFPGKLARFALNGLRKVSGWRGPISGLLGQCLRAEGRARTSWESGPSDGTEPVPSRAVAGLVN